MNHRSFRKALLVANPDGDGTVVVTFYNNIAAVVLGSAVDTTDTSEFRYPDSGGSTKSGRYEDVWMVLPYHSSVRVHR